jgi:hypothetical protein
MFAAAGWLDDPSGPVGAAGKGAPMNPRRALAIGLLVPFTLLTAYAVMEVGVLGIFRSGAHDPGAWQIFADLVVSLLLVLVWLVSDARQNGRNPWPWVVATLFTGSFAPLLYLATSPSAPHAPSRS